MKTDQLLLDQRGDRLPSDYIAAAGKSSEPSGENQTEESAARRVISMACGSWVGTKRLILTTSIALAAGETTANWRDASPFRRHLHAAHLRLAPN